jgi:hypothetical protein
MWRQQRHPKPAKRVEIFKVRSGLACLPAYLRAYARLRGQHVLFFIPSALRLCYSTVLSLFINVSPTGCVNISCPVITFMLFNNSLIIPKCIIGRMCEYCSISRPLNIYMLFNGTLIIHKCITDRNANIISLAVR